MYSRKIADIFGYHKELITGHWRILNVKVDSASKIKGTGEELVKRGAKKRKQERKKTNKLRASF